AVALRPLHRGRDGDGGAIRNRRHALTALVYTHRDRAGIAHVAVNGAVDGAIADDGTVAGNENIVDIQSSSRWDREGISRGNGKVLGGSGTGAIDLASGALEDYAAPIIGRII